jgi:hypothetical protein
MDTTSLRKLELALEALILEEGVCLSALFAYLFLTP